MAQGQSSNRVLVRGAEQALDNFKYEAAREIGIENQIQGGYWGDLPARQCGAVGGHMVKRMIELAERQLAGTRGTTGGGTTTR
ncbi:MAG: small, acid-soluble spore protein, alpha/beta type [Bacillota bacterium]